MFAARAVAADRTQVFTARQRVIRWIRRDRLALTTGRRAQEVAVATGIEGSWKAENNQSTAHSFRRYDVVSKTHPGLLGPDGLKFPGLMSAVSGFISSGLCGPTDDIDILLSRLSPAKEMMAFHAI